MQRAPLPRVRYIIALTAACSLCGETSASAGDWTFTPRIVGQELYTDNVLLTPTNRRSDLVTTLAPGLNITGQSERLSGTFDYSPSVQIYALTHQLNFVGQNLYANGTATIVPDLFFIDGRGFLSVQPSIPGLGTGILPGTVAPLLSPTVVNTSAAIPSSQLAQVQSFSASPYLARRFDGVGSAELRYTFSDTNFSGLQSLTTPTTPTPAGTALQNTSNVTNEVTAAFATGENLGRLQSRFLLDAGQSTGTTPSNQLIGTIDSGYAITERITALATIGHEQINFSGVPPINIDDLVWGVGAQFKPNPDATILLSYGHRNGFSAPNASLTYNLTARTKLSATYSEGLSTIAQEIANNLAISDVNQFGQAVDTRTLLPFLIANPTIGLQGGIFRSKQFNATATTDFDRDHFTATINKLDNILVSQTTAGSGTSQNTLQAYFSWAHDLTPRTTTTLGVGYAQLDFGLPANTQETILTANLSVSYMLTASMTGWARYDLLDRMSPQPQFRLTSNVIAVGIRKEF